MYRAAYLLILILGAVVTLTSCDKPSPPGSSAASNAAAPGNESNCLQHANIILMFGRRQQPKASYWLAPSRSGVNAASPQLTFDGQTASWSLISAAKISFCAEKSQHFDLSTGSLLPATAYLTQLSAHGNHHLDPIVGQFTIWGYDPLRQNGPGAPVELLQA